MGEAAATTFIDYDRYLAIERERDQKHEWFDGQVYAMAGGTLEHSAIAVRLSREILALIGEGGCQVFNSDAKIRVLATGLATYADAAVVCGPVERDPQDRNAMTNPAVVVEVLSDGTEAYDRGEKFRHYRQLPSLRDYVLVSQHEPHVEVYSRTHEGTWSLTEAAAGESFRVTALDGAISVDHVYAGVELTPRPAR